MINADELWQEGITGEGVLVCNFDSGVQGDPEDPNGHIAFRDRWRGNQPGIHPEWAFIDLTEGSTGRPVDYSNYSHGTHTMGTITGLDSENADTIGVAFGAEWISAAITSQESNYVQNAIAAFQWAIDPDGNPFTNSDVPDVINHSWGISFIPCELANFPDLDNGIDAIEIAGTINIWCAGNEYCPVCYPASRSLGVVKEFAVGAIDENKNIADFSSGEYSGCISPYNLKPEVVAPGVEVRSSIKGIGGNNYGLMDGTSMATPHVSGAAALLRQFYPEASPEQIKLALLASAKGEDLGDIGEDISYGLGLIDVAYAKDLLPCVQKGNNNILIDCTVNCLEI